MISVFIFTSNDFQPWKKEERERERARRSPCQSKNTTRSHRSKTIAPLRSFKPTLVKPSHRSSRLSRHFRTTCKERERRESREIVKPTRTAPITLDRTALTNPPLRRTHSSNPPLRRMGFLSLRSHH